MIKICLIFILYAVLCTCANGNDSNENKKNCVPSVTKSSGSESIKGPYCSGQLIFEDDFRKFDFEKWQHENTLAGGNNWEFQWYTNNRSNSFVKDEILHIRPTLTADTFGEQFLSSGVVEVNGGSPADQCTNAAFFGCARVGTEAHIINPIRSARIRTVESFNFKYGRVDVRAKMPTGDWLWPAIWLLPKRNVYGGWPASGEIDIVESRGNLELLNEEGDNIGVFQIGTTLHYGPDSLNNGYEKASITLNSTEGFHKDFHNYSMIWTPESLTFFVDNEETGSFKMDDGFFARGNFSEELDNPWKYSSKMAPFDEEFYFTINLAVGGTSGYFPDLAENPTTKPWENNSTQAATDFWNGRSDWLPTWNYDDKENYDRDLQVDFVRVYAL